VNGLQLIARAHQLVNEGYKVCTSPPQSLTFLKTLKYHFKDKDVVTVWSAPNYCYRCGNVASIMNLGDDLQPSFQIFSAVPDNRRAVPAGRGTRGEYFL
jgi:serine/threonine-protein phosphatase PP1-1